MITPQEIEQTNKLLDQSTKIMALLNEYYEDMDMGKAEFFRKVWLIVADK